MNTTDEIAIQVKGLTKSFKGKKSVDAIDLTIKKGEVFAILGPNVAGKTTVVRMMSTLLKADSGNIKIFGYDAVKEAAKVRKLIGLTGQYASVDEDLTAWENLMIFTALNGLDKKQSKAKATQLLEDFTLLEAKDKQIKNFSGGMHRRLDLAVSLIANPPLVFLDEPTTGLDPRTREQMWDVIRQMIAKGTTVLLTTQYLEEADQLADHIALIDKGKLVIEGTPDELKREVGELKFIVTFDTNATNAGVALIEEVFDHSSGIAINGNEIQVPVESTLQISDFFVKAGQRKIDINVFSMQKPTLDDVFFKLTEDNK
ncbi:ATP-binding cassette domain-containing protein [Lactococcus laudensis]|uniref:ATP-binding cassette domain-containing protein n=1 Tax=Pseudolactococcus laudensis TaxID=1494461 RepID=A0A7V8N112_9LACT|nr:ATP-binding cassette domain-containing protein [Lactococcus laudensis]MBA0016646.1 ATP-binding cassette domain-containing protein [Lactococcus laudensis]MBW9281350.1 ATP-binding cassette domain-containing protein [Lactococcus laudensis]